MTVLPLAFVLCGAIMASGNPFGLPKLDSSSKFRGAEVTTAAGIDDACNSRCFTHLKITDEMATRLSKALLNCVSLSKLPTKSDALKEAKSCQRTVSIVVEKVAKGVDVGLSNPGIGEAMDQGLTHNVTDINAEIVPPTEATVLERKKRSSEDELEDEASDEWEWTEDEDSLESMRSFLSAGGRRYSLRALEEGSAEAIALPQNKEEEEEHGAEEDAEEERTENETLGTNLEKYQIEENTNYAIKPNDKDENASWNQKQGEELRADQDTVHRLLSGLGGIRTLLFLTDILSGHLQFQDFGCERMEGSSHKDRSGEADSPLFGSSDRNTIKFPGDATDGESSASSYSNLTSLLWDTMRNSLRVHIQTCTARELGMLNGTQYFDAMLFKDFISMGFENKTDSELLLLLSLIESCDLATQATEEKDRPRELLEECLQLKILATCKNGGAPIDRDMNRPGIHKKEKAGFQSTLGEVGDTSAIS